MFSHSETAALKKKYIVRYSFFLLCTIAVISFLFYNFYFIVRREFIDEIRHCVKHLAITIALNLDPEELQQIQGASDMDTKLYKKLQNHLYQYKSSFDDIRYIYIMRRSMVDGASKSDFEYVVDMPAEDENKDGVINASEKSEIPGTLYDAAELPAMVNAWDRPDADQDIAPDPPYPDLLSGYAPVKDASGKTYAIVGVDITAAAITAKMKIVCNAIIFYAVCLILLISIILVLLARFQLVSEELKLMNKELKETMSLRDKFSKMIIHDLRNPLAYILGASNLYKDYTDESPEEIRQVFWQLESQAVRMKNLMENMLFLAKSEHGELILNKESHDIKNIIIEAVANNKALADMTDVELITELPEGTYEYLLDEDLFIRVFDNLISNAMKFSDEGDPIIISLEYLSSQDYTFEVRVIDRGPGIPKDKSDEIFGLFKGGTKTNASMSSFGIGLAFCKMVVEAHGGTISVEDNKPTGSVFVIKI